MKKLLVCLLALLLAAAPALGADLTPRRKGEAASEPAEAILSVGRLEGEDFASPEEAVTAYLQAMKAGDVAGMLSTFAIETCVENCDILARMERAQSFSPRPEFPMGTDDPYLAQISAATRYSDLSNDLYFQYMAFSWPEEYGRFNRVSAFFKQDGEANAFLESLSAANFAAALREMELTGFTSAQDMVDEADMEIYFLFVEELSRDYGCDEILDMAARVNLGGEEYYQLLVCARYGEKWYNLEFGGILSAFLDFSEYNAGLILAYEVEER